MTDPVQLERRGTVAILTLNAPARRNALSLAMRTRLRDTLRDLGADPGVRALVLTGAQGQFCAGGDVSEMKSGEAGGAGQPSARARLEILHESVRMLVAGPLPVIAAVEGNAAGAGMSLACACDHVVASESAKFVAAFGGMGLVAECGLIWTLPRRVGERVARDLLLTARTVDAAEALRIGLVDRVVPAGGALEAAIEACGRYGAVAPLSIAATRRMLGRLPPDLDGALAVESDVQATLGLSEDHQEARRAFLEKRAPVFNGR